jgi:NTE family protein
MQEQLERGDYYTCCIMIWCMKKYLIINPNDTHMIHESSIPERQRAFVFAGGGSLGAYETGAYKAIYEFIRRRDEEQGIKGRPVFDIIAGTSIGAMNAAVLVSYVVENGTYEGSAQRLVDFWEYLCADSMIESNPFFKYWWDYWRLITKDFATGEAARRFYATREFATYGVPNVFYPFIPSPDKKFLHPFNTWFQYSNEPLKRSLERFVRFPIKTSYDDNQPRLILTAVDVAEGIPVTFDSYPKEDGHRKTGYGRYISREGEDIGFEHLISYDEGITSDQVMASGSLPINFDYTKIEVESYKDNHSGGRKEIDGNRLPDGNNSATIDDTDSHYYAKEIRHFWDGGLMTNTPLMQLVLLHRYFWYRVKGLKDNVPGLVIGIINLHPTAQPEIPSDYDGALSRKSDISFSDRSRQEEAILILISDYVGLIRSLISLAHEGGIKEERINNLLEQPTRLRGLLYQPKKIRETIEGRFEIDEVIRVERRNDPHTISDKIFDFSRGTINALLREGYEDANIELTEVANRMKRAEREKIRKQ